jgi:hypothetical protein
MDPLRSTRTQQLGRLVVLMACASCAPTARPVEAKPAPQPTAGTPTRSSRYDKTIFSGGATQCPKPSPLNEDIRALLDKGLCVPEEQFLGKPVCEEWHAFLLSGPRSLPAGSLALGTTFRVERATNGAIAWSEQNPMPVLLGAGATAGGELTARLMFAFPDNDEEAKEGAAFVTAAFAGLREPSSPFYRYAQSEVQHANLLTMKESQEGWSSDLGCDGLLYVRQRGGRIYLLLSTKHSNDFDFDSHPVLYFSVLTPM